MRFGLKKNIIIPTDKLQVVIRPDGSIGMVQRHQAAPLVFSPRQLQMIAAFSNGDIPNMKRGLISYLKKAGMNGEQVEKCERLARKLMHQSRLCTAQESDLPAVAQSMSAEVEQVAVPDSPFVLKTPSAFLPRRGGFQAIGHDGRALPLLSSVELHALSKLVLHPGTDAALAAHREEFGDLALDREQFLQVIRPFVAAHYTAIIDLEDTSTSSVEMSNRVLSGDSSQLTLQKFREHAARQDEEEAKREEATGRRRTKVIPVAFDTAVPAGLGAIVASARAHEDGALDEFYNFRTDWIWDEDRLPKFTAEPAIYLFSNYLWSHRQCIEVSEKIKALSPNSITIHGGPDTPKYEGDERNYFADYPHVDITIRGEGELSCAEVLSKLRQVIGDENPDLGLLEGIPGATYRGADGEVVRNPDRDRIKDLNDLPSAYLTGLFDAYIGLDDLYVILETNRGCPYGCTFCDWGSATASKIRKFDEERVMAEIGWASKGQVLSVSIADANFGIFPRDVEFAREAARLKRESGFPRGFGGNYAKNTVKYLRNIIDVLAEGDILTLGTLSLQTMDEDTLDAINRANIKTEKYDSLAVEMRNSNLPLTIELMMGLPGSTVDSFREDLQQCIDRELPVRVNMTTLLVNSPMNDPKYLQEHQIETTVPIGPGNLPLIASTSSFTRMDLEKMTFLRETYMLFENYGVLRLISRFVRQECGIEEMRFYERLMARSAEQETWPFLFVLCNGVSFLMAPPVSWYLMIEEMGRFLMSEFGLQDTPALRSILAAQLSCLPAHDRQFPEQVSFECDVVAWFDAMLEEKEKGNKREWETAVPRLGEYPAATMTVDDPHGVSNSALGINREINVFGINWELESPLHRARADLN